MNRGTDVNRNFGFKWGEIGLFTHKKVNINKP